MPKNNLSTCDVCGMYCSEVYVNAILGKSGHKNCLKILDDEMQATARRSARNPLPSIQGHHHIEEDMRKIRVELEQSVGIPEEEFLKVDYSKGRDKGVETELHHLKGKKITLNGKEVGTITEAKITQEIPEGVEVKEITFEAEIVDKEVLDDIKYGKHRHISIGSNLEDSSSVGEGEIG